MIAAAITTSTSQPARSPTKLGDIAIVKANGSQLTEKPTFYEFRCRAAVGRILEAATTRSDARWLGADYLKLSISDLSSRCRNSQLTAPLRAQSKALYEHGLLISNLAASGLEPFLVADASFSSGNFTDGFRAFAKSDQFQYQITSQSSKGRAYYFAGFKDAASGHFKAAENDFKEAHTFATRAYPFADSLYFLGVSRLAQGKVHITYQTFCTGVGEYVHAIAPPGDYKEPPGLIWDFLIANRIAHL